MENYYKGILEKIEVFSNSKPANGYEVEYLEKASRIFDLYSEASMLIEDGTEKNDKKIEELFRKVNAII